MARTSTERSARAVDLDPSARPAVERGNPAHLLLEDPFRVLVRLAAPTSAVMSVAAVSNILHTYFVSRLGADAIAAVSLVFPVFLIMTTLIGGGVGAGVASAVARALGAGKTREASDVVEHAFVFTGSIAVIASAVFVPEAPAIFRAMGGTGTVLDDAVAFAQIAFGGLLITFIVATCDSVMRGQGNVRVPAICSTFSLATQIALTPVFMFAFGWGIRGAPAATLVGQSLTLGPRLWYVFGRRSLLRPRLLPLFWKAAPVVEILRVGVPASLGTLFNYAGMMVLTTIVARLGNAELAAFGLCTRLDFILMTLSYGTGVAVLTLVGLASGAGRPNLIDVFARRALLLVAVPLSAVALLLWLRPGLWVGLFTADPQIAAVGARYFHIVGPAYPLMGCSMVLAFVFQGTGRATPPLLTVSARVLGVTLGALLLTTRFGYGDASVFALLAAGYCVSSGLLFTLFLRRLKTSRV